MIHLTDDYVLDVHDNNFIDGPSYWVIQRRNGHRYFTVNDFPTLSKAIKGAIDIMLRDAVQGVNGPAITDLATLAATAENYRKTITEKLEGKI